MLYSLKGSFPKRLPEKYVRMNLSDDELFDIGYVPVEMPLINVTNQKLEWTGTKFEIVEKTEKEKLSHKSENISIDNFLFEFLNGKFYSQLKILSLNNPELSFLINEFFMLLNTKNSKYNTIIQKNINIFFIYLNKNLDQYEYINCINSFKSHLTNSNLDVLFNVPDEIWLEKYDYDSRIDSIYPKEKPFSSWILNSDGEWMAPIEKPKDGRNYEWCEEQKKWTIFK